MTSTTHTPRVRKPSGAMLRVLQNLRDGREPWAHIRGRSQHGGANSTRTALIERGLVEYRRDRRMHLTPAGVALVGQGPGTLPPPTTLCTWCGEEPAMAGATTCAACDADVSY